MAWFCAECWSEREDSQRMDEVFHYDPCLEPQDVSRRIDEYDWDSLRESLSERHWKVLVCLFIEGRQLKELAAYFRVSPERIRQMARVAIRLCRRPSLARFLGVEPPEDIVFPYFKDVKATLVRLRAEGKLSGDVVCEHPKDVADRIRWKKELEKERKAWEREERRLERERRVDQDELDELARLRDRQRVHEATISQSGWNRWSYFWKMRSEEFNNK